MIGLIALSTDLTIERDFHNHCDDVVTTRVLFENPLTPLNLYKLRDRISLGRSLLPQCEKYVFGCTSGTAVIGLDYFGDQIITSIGSAIKWLDSHSKTQLDVITPYPQNVHQIVVDAFTEAGLEVQAQNYLDYNDDKKIANLTQQQVRDHIDNFTPKSDVVFLSCTAFPVVDIIDSLPYKCISSNSAMIWEINNS